MEWKEIRTASGIIEFQGYLRGLSPKETIVILDEMTEELDKYEAKIKEASTSRGKAVLTRAGRDARKRRARRRP